jgi:hypothetical protein
MLPQRLSASPNLISSYRLDLGLSRCAIVPGNIVIVYVGVEKGTDSGHADQTKLSKHENCTRLTPPLISCRPVQL